MSFPQFTHDCDKCVFLGEYTKAGESSVDLYYCPDIHRPSLASFISRYGNRGSQYTSSHPPEAFADGCMPSAWEKELIKRAKEAGVYIQPLPAKIMQDCQGCGKHRLFSSKKFYCSAACSMKAWR